jgi:uncharacterized protein with HEPN domain
MNTPRDRLQRDLVKCEDMRVHTERAIKYMAGRSLSEFAADDFLQAAVVRCIEVIGEAARLVSEETRLRSPDIPWASIVGLRNILAHDYSVVRLDRVHDVVANHLEPLRVQLTLLVKTLETEVGWREEG